MHFHWTLGNWVDHSASKMSHTKQVQIRALTRREHLLHTDISHSCSLTIRKKHSTLLCSSISLHWNLHQKHPQLWIGLRKIFLEEQFTIDKSYSMHFQDGRIHSNRVHVIGMFDVMTFFEHFWVAYAPSFLSCSCWGHKLMAWVALLVNVILVVEWFSVRCCVESSLVLKCDNSTLSYLTLLSFWVVLASYHVEEVLRRFLGNDWTKFQNSSLWGNTKIERRSYFAGVISSSVVTKVQCGPYNQGTFFLSENRRCSRGPANASSLQRAWILL